MKYVLLLYFIGNSKYLIINCVPKLVWDCSQAIGLRHINKVFYSILFYSIPEIPASVLLAQPAVEKLD